MLVIWLCSAAWVVWAATSGHVHWRQRRSHRATSFDRRFTLATAITLALLSAVALWAPRAGAQEGPCRASTAAKV